MCPYINNYVPTEEDYLAFWKCVQEKDNKIHVTISMFSEKL